MSTDATEEARAASHWRDEFGQQARSDNVAALRKLMELSPVADTYATTLRLKPHIGELLERVSDRLGMSKTAVLIAALHDYARKHEVER